MEMDCLFVLLFYLLSFCPFLRGSIFHVIPSRVLRYRVPERERDKERKRKFAIVDRLMGNFPGFPKTFSSAHIPRPVAQCFSIILSERILYCLPFSFLLFSCFVLVSPPLPRVARF
uniref:Putative secreted peptide n=1 Tax=Anopheles braziliensis TaxID=58242 RepID=A0A2M3ZN27_9DIPT